MFRRIRAANTRLENWVRPYAAPAFIVAMVIGICRDLWTHGTIPTNRIYIYALGLLALLPWWLIRRQRLRDEDDGPA